MKKRLLFLLLFCLLISLQSNASRAMYVNNFEHILGNIPAENTLLAYAQSHGVETLLLYGLHIVHANHNLPNASTNIVLANFISKAKTSYGITKIGATAENANFFTNVIQPYNDSRSNPIEKFDIYNLEFEYWSIGATGPGGYYCTTYLNPNNIPCTVVGAFQYYVSIIQTMNTLATTSTHPITTEAYVGWPSVGQADTLGGLLDHLRLHAYVSSPSTAFIYTSNRLLDFANGTPSLSVSIIFSAEPAFMQYWLQSNSMIAAENQFTSDWMNGSAAWPNNITLEGFTYFAYTHMGSISLPIELVQFEGQQEDNNIILRWSTASEYQSDYFEIQRQDPLSLSFEALGQISASGNSTKEQNYQFVDIKPPLGANYYRLLQMDLNGDADYSSLIKVDYNQYGKKWKIYPTLARDFLYIENGSSSDQFTMYDLQGRLLKVTSTMQSEELCYLDLKTLPPGMYVLQLNKRGLIEWFRFLKI